MGELVAKRSAVVDKLLKNVPSHEPEVEDAIENYREGRARSRESSMLDLRLLNGTIESFAYTYLTRVTFVPGDTITMHFGGEEVRVKGRNLARLCETITEQRTRFIQEATEGEDGLKPEDAAHVEQISITPREEA